MVKKTKVQLVRERIVSRIQEEFYVTDGELIAKTLNPHWLTPNDVMVTMQAQYGVFVSEREYTSWGEFINVMAKAVVKFS